MYSPIPLTNTFLLVFGRYHYVISCVIYCIALLFVFHAIYYNKDSGAPPSSGLRPKYFKRNKLKEEIYDITPFKPKIVVSKLKKYSHITGTIKNGINHLNNLIGVLRDECFNTDWFLLTFNLIYNIILYSLLLPHKLQGFHKPLKRHI